MQSLAHLGFFFFFFNVPSMGRKARPQQGFHNSLCGTPPPSSFFPGGLLMPLLTPSLLSTCMSGQRGPTRVPHEINYHTLNTKWKCLLKVQKYSFLIGGRLWKWWEGRPEKCGEACNIPIFSNPLTISAVRRRNMRAAFKLPCIAAIALTSHLLKWPIGSDFLVYVRHCELDSEQEILSAANGPQSSGKMAHKQLWWCNDRHVAMSLSTGPSKYKTVQDRMVVSGDVAGGEAWYKWGGTFQSCAGDWHLHGAY